MKKHYLPFGFRLVQFMNDTSTLIQDTFRHYLKKKKMKKMSELKVVLLGDPMAKQIVHSSRLVFQKVYTYL